MELIKAENNNALRKAALFDAIIIFLRISRSRLFVLNNLKSNVSHLFSFLPFSEVMSLV